VALAVDCASYFLLPICDPCSHCFFLGPSATTEIYTLSLHDALPISRSRAARSTCCATSSSALKVAEPRSNWSTSTPGTFRADEEDRKSTRLNSSHVKISYAVFCLKKKKNNGTQNNTSTANI